MAELTLTVNEDIQTRSPTPPCCKSSLRTPSPTSSAPSSTRWRSPARPSTDDAPSLIVRSSEGLLRRAAAPATLRLGVPPRSRARPLENRRPEAASIASSCSPTGARRSFCRNSQPSPHHHPRSSSLPLRRWRSFVLALILSDPPTTSDSINDCDGNASLLGESHDVNVERACNLESTANNHRTNMLAARAALLNNFNIKRKRFSEVARILRTRAPQHPAAPPWVPDIPSLVQRMQ